MTHEWREHPSDKPRKSEPREPDEFEHRIEGLPKSVKALLRFAREHELLSGGEPRSCPHPQVARATGSAMKGFTPEGKKATRNYRTNPRTLVVSSRSDRVAFSTTLAHVSEEYRPQLGRPGHAPAMRGPGLSSGWFPPSVQHLFPSPRARGEWV
jgi:hypothetical protein